MLQPLLRALPLPIRVLLRRLSIHPRRSARVLALSLALLAALLALLFSIHRSIAPAEADLWWRPAPQADVRHYQLSDDIKPCRTTVG